MTEQALKELLMPYADGELEPALAAQVEQALTENAALRAELEEIQTISALARTAFEAPEVDLSGVYDGVMARLGLEEVTPVAAPSVWARAKTWVGELFRFEHPWVLVGGGLAAAAAVLAINAAGTSEQASATEQATIASKENPRRRGAEGEIKSMGRDSGIIVEHLEAQKGKVKAEFDDDPEAPMVLWHVVDEENTVAPKGL